MSKEVFVKKKLVYLIVFKTFKPFLHWNLPEEVGRNEIILDY